MRKYLDILAAVGLDGILLVDPGNIMALWDFNLPFPYHFDEKKIAGLLLTSGEGLFFAPPDYCQAVQRQLEDSNRNSPLCIPLDENDPFPENIKYGEHLELGALSAVVRYLKENYSPLKLGLEWKYLAVKQHNSLKSSLPGTLFLPCDELLETQRLVKTPEEIERICKAARSADMGFVGALNHIEGTVGLQEYTMAEVAERVRVHAVEFESTGVGFLSAAQGADLSGFYADPSPELLKNDTYLRMELTTQFNGLWARGARTVFSGDSTGRTEYYKQLMEITRFAARQLKPGRVCEDVYSAVVEYANLNGIRFEADYGLGHGIGWNEIEAPYLIAGDMRKLAPGMVLSLGVYILTEKGELLHNREMYEITPGGSRSLSRMRSWENLYCVDGFRTTH